MQKAKLIDANNLNAHLSNSYLVITCVYLMLLSYFYNLPVLNYSLTGNNEFRLFDIAGFLLFYPFYSNKNLIISVIRNYSFFKTLYNFLLWATFTLIFTFGYSFYEGNLVLGIQSVLYLFHFWTFFITAVFLFILIQNLVFLKTIVSVTLILSCAAFTIVILQNFEVIPFLWGDIYKTTYEGFLSGTLGPNKIVLGMTCLFIFIFALGLLNEKRVNVNKILLLTTISISLITLILSGSRTTYVGLLTFAIYYFFRDFVKFLYSIIFLFLAFLIISSVNKEIFEKLTAVYEYRIENKIRNPNSLKEARVDELYEDLGAGRKELSLMYIESLLNNAYMVPFGLGFNNRLLNDGTSAHNIYLSLIAEIGLVGLFFYLSWFISMLKTRLPNFVQLEVAFHGLILAMLVTLFFGEHIYVYRTSFGLTGLFLFVSVIFVSPLHQINLFRSTEQSN